VPILTRINALIKAPSFTAEPLPLLPTFCSPRPSSGYCRLGNIPVFISSAKFRPQLVDLRKPFPVSSLLPFSCAQATTGLRECADNGWNI